MSSVTLSHPTAGATPAPARGRDDPRPSFWGLLRGDALKLRRMWTTWISVVLLSGVIALPYLAMLARPGSIKDAAGAPAAVRLAVLLPRLGGNFIVLRFFAPLVVIILTARLIGMEYSSGTIRILLARGVGRLQFLGAKLLVATGVALALALWGLLLNAAFTVVLLLAINGNLGMLPAASSVFWQAAGIETLVLVITLEAMALLAMAVAVVSRSTAFGLSAGLAWFLADSMFVPIFFYLAYRLTGGSFWQLITGDLLVPNLNVMASLLLPKAAAGAELNVLPGPLVPVTSGHTLLVVAIYGAIFLGVSAVLIVRRDVRE